MKHILQEFRKTKKAAKPKVAKFRFTNYNCVPLLKPI